MQIIASILSGESELFHCLIRPYERSVYLMALSLLHNEADAEDVAQQAFLKAFREIEGFRGESKFGTWLISITLNEARTFLRRKKLLQTESLDEPLNERATFSPALLRDWKDVPSKALERQEVRLMLQKAIALLPPIYREIFVLRDLEDLSIAQAAEILKVKPATVKVRLHRARTMLQKTLAPQLSQINSRRRWSPGS